jgi:uncharacterized membrane protein
MRALFQRTKTPSARLAERKKGPRIFEIDFARGLAVFLMIIDHLAYDFSTLNLFFPNFYEVNNSIGNALLSFGAEVWISSWQLVLHFFFAGLFMFLSGVSCTLAKSNGQRGIKLAYVAVLLSIFMEAYSFFMNEDENIYCGILHAIAIGIILYAIVDHFLKSPWVDWAVGGLLLALTLVSVDLTNPGLDYPSGLSVMERMAFAIRNYPLLLVGQRAAGADYFCPLPVTGVIFLGAAFGKTFYVKNRRSLVKNAIGPAAEPIIFLGNHSLALYLLHQPLLVVLLALTLYPLGYRM